MMMCARGFCVSAIVFSLFVCLPAAPGFCKDARDGKASDSMSITGNPDRSDQFHWSEHKKLSWEDFRGAVNSASDESAAATHCGIGFKVNLNGAGNKPDIMVYNNFYANKSWVKTDAKIQSILDHEQGHFDLCEIYTRKLRVKMANFDVSTPDLREALISAYKEISLEYESRQQAYEQETIHGTNNEKQKKWLDMIARELSVNS